MMSPGWHMPVDAVLGGVALDRQMLLNLWISLALFVAANVVLLAGVLRPWRPQPLTHTRWRLELLPLAALAVLFFALALRSERLWARARYSGASPAAMQVEAVGMQFAWYFRYPGRDAAFGPVKDALIDAGAGNPVGVNSADERGRDDFVRPMLVLPAGREVDLRVRALDVIHGFAIPELRVKQNAMPGQTFHVHFTPETPGDYSILCTQVCGIGHARMQAVVRVLPPKQFETWLAAQENAR